MAMLNNQMVEQENQCLIHQQMQQVATSQYKHISFWKSSLDGLSAICRDFFFGIVLHVFWVSTV